MYSVSPVTLAAPIVRAARYRRGGGVAIATSAGSDFVNLLYQSEATLVVATWRAARCAAGRWRAIGT
jgi:hypothetical protein